MTPRTTVLLAVALASSVTTVAWLASRAFHAASELESQRQRITAVVAKVAELDELRQRVQVVTIAQAQDEDLTRRVTKTLASAGLPAAALSSVTPDADQPAGRTSQGNAAFIRRSARLTLDGLTLPQLGRFLEAWRSSTEGRGWTVAAIDITQGTSEQNTRIKNAGQETPRRDQPLRVLLAVQAIVQPEPPPPSPPRSLPTSTP